MRTAVAELGRAFQTNTVQHSSSSQLFVFARLLSLRQGPIAPALLWAAHLSAPHLFLVRLLRGP